MVQTALSLPLRLAARAGASTQAWVCTRCMATQSTSSSNVASSGSRNRVKFQLDKRASLQSGTPPQTWIDRWIAEKLPHPVPIQYLQHATPDKLSEEEREWRSKMPSHKQLVGVVVSAGKMDKTVKVRIPGQRWEKKIGKYFSQPTNHLVHDPRSSLAEGDVVSLHRLRVSSAVHHVVASIITPFGKPIEARPPIPSPDERLAEYKWERSRKLHRRALRAKASQGSAKAIRTLQSMGLHAGPVAESDIKHDAKETRNVTDSTTSKRARSRRSEQQSPKATAESNSS